MHGAEADREAIIKANELYWSSELSVNQIADQMDLSKGTLYGMILPEGAGLWCPDCGAEGVFGNRTAKERGHISCAECGWEGDEDDAESIGGDGSVTLPVYEDPESEAETGPPPTLPTDRGRNRILVGGAMLGAAAGLALVFWARRR
jgi:predicted RNA-binding Zn-ribbon protein involved in translation (DUF1610 family)